MAPRIRFWRSCSLAVAGIVTTLLCFACESNSSSSSENPGGNDDDNEAPLATIQFPPNGCLTDAAQVNLSIAAVDETDVVFVAVDGVPAFLAPDSLWRVSVPLREGNNALFVETRDTLGNSNPRAARLSIRRESALWVETAGVAFDALAGEALVLDPELRALFGVQPVTGVRTLRSGPGVGAGALFSSARDVDYVDSLHAAVVVDGALDAVILVNLTTGTRATLSSPGIGGGPTPLDLHGIAVDEDRNRALVVDEVRAELMAVDLATGLRSTISGGALGSGPPLIVPRGVALDLVRNRALVVIGLSRSILAVDLASGNRTVFSGGATGGGPAFVTPLDLVVDPFQDRVIVADPGARALFDVDLSTGARQILSSPARGAGPAWLRPTGVSLHLGSVPLVVDSAMDALVEVGAFSGDRRLLSGIAQGSGPQFSRPAALASRFVVADPTALFEVDISNGARVLLSGQSRGSGAPFLDLTDAAVSPPAVMPCPTLVLDAGLPGILGVDPLSGDRSVISAGAIGSGPPFSGPRRMDLETDTGGCASSALVVDKPLVGPGAILRVDRSTGARTVLSDATHGLGAALIDPVAIEIDAALGVAYVLDALVPGIFSIDLVTGDRVLIFQFLTSSRELTDLTFEASRSRFLVSVTGTSALLAANLLTQTETVLSGALTGSGPAFGQPVALELVPSATVGSIPSTMVAYVLDSSRGSILAVDPASGDRVILSK